MNNTNFLFFPELISIYKLKFEEEKLEKFVKNFNFVKNEFGESHRSEKHDILDQFKELKEQILLCCNDYLNNQFKLDVEFKITDSWLTMTKKNGYSHKHYHSHSFLSGVFYLSLKDKAEIKFYKKYINDFWTMNPKEFNVVNSDSWNISVKNNDLILFKSYLEHEIVKYVGEENRYSLSFNVIPIGNLGKNTSRITLV